MVDRLNPPVFLKLVVHFSCACPVGAQTSALTIWRPKGQRDKNNHQKIEEYSRSAAGG